MVTEADHKHWRPEHCAPYVEHVLNCFGEDRVMFGSDWPVCLPAASYAEVIETLRGILTRCLPAPSLDNVFFQNGNRFYGVASGLEAGRFTTENTENTEVGTG
jgi:L-fuconolactonase